MPGELTFDGRRLCFLHSHARQRRTAYRITKWVIFLVELLLLTPKPSYSVKHLSFSALDSNIREGVGLHNDISPTYRNGRNLAFFQNGSFSYAQKVEPWHTCQTVFNSTPGVGNSFRRQTIRKNIKRRGGKILKASLHEAKEYDSTKEGSTTVSISDNERMKICSTMDALFDKCVNTCKEDNVVRAMDAIQDYIKAYAEFFCPFFENPVEVNPPGSEHDDVVSVEENRDQLSHQNSDESNEKSSATVGKPVDSSSQSLSFYYTVDDLGADGKDERRHWYVQVKPRLCRNLHRLITKYRDRCIHIMSRMMHKVSTMEELRAVTSVSKEASRLGMMVMKAMYHAMSAIHAKLGRCSKALEYIERMWSCGERRRHRSYEPLLSYFEENNDAEGIIYVLRHMVDVAGLSVSGLLFTRVLTTIAISARMDLLNLSNNDNDSQHSEQSNIEYVPCTDQADEVGAINHGRLPASTLGPNPGAAVSKSNVYTDLKSKLQEVLEIYKMHSCDKVSLSSRLGYVLSKVFESIKPGLFSLTTVSPSAQQQISNASSKFNSPMVEECPYESYISSSKHHDYTTRVHSGSHGECFSCRAPIPLLDLPINERLSVFQNWLQHIYDYNFPEVGRLANFYSWLHASMREGRTYTCILDGQNIGYHKRQLMTPLDFGKIDMVVREMNLRGERPLVVLPHYARGRHDSSSLNDIVEKETIALLFPSSNSMVDSLSLSDVAPKRQMTLTHEDLALLDHWKEMNQVYFCKMGSYDDNYFFLANLMTGCAEEMEIMARFLKSSLELSSNKSKSSILNGLPTPKVEDYISIANTIKRRPVMITVTNDTFTNLEVPGVDEKLMRVLRDVPLTPFFFSSDRGSFNTKFMRGRKGNGYKVTIGNRLKYTLEMQQSTNGNYHIPLGYERKVLDFKSRHVVVVHKNEHARVEPPLVGGFLEQPDETSDKSDHNADQELRQTNKWLERHGYTELLAALEDRNDDNIPRYKEGRGFVISTKTPEIIKQKFNPSQETLWLCVALSTIDV